MIAEALFEIYTKALPIEEQQRFCDMLNKINTQKPKEQKPNKNYNARHLILTMPKRKIPTQPNSCN